MKLYTPGETPPEAKGGIVLLFGMESVGKSTMAIRSEDVANPLFYNNFDRDAAHLLKARTAPYHYEQYRARTHAEANAQLTKFDDSVTLATRSPVNPDGTRGVFAIDGGSYFWDIVKLAKLPANDDDPPPKAYDEANSYVDDHLLHLTQSGLWVVITSPAKEVWTRERSGSGEYEARGWNRMKFHIIVEAMMFLDTKPRGTLPVPLASTFNYTYNCYIKTSKRRPMVEGVVIADPTLRKLLEKTKEIKSLTREEITK